MAAASGAYGITLRDVLDATRLDIDTENDTITITLHTDSYTPDFNTHDAHADLTNEVSGSGYTANSKALASVTLSATSGFLTFDAADTSWTGATFSNAEQRVVNDGTLTNDPLLFCTDLGSAYSVTAGTFTIQEHV